MRKGIETRIFLIILFAAIVLVLVVSAKAVLDRAKDMGDRVIKSSDSGGYTPEDIKARNECQAECLNSPDPEVCMESCG